MELWNKSLYDRRIYLPAWHKHDEKSQWKLEVYPPLVRDLQILHPSYKFEFAPIVVGAMGYVPKCLVTYLKMVGFEGKDIKLLIRRMQVKSISGSVKICKTFLNFNDF